MKQEEDEINFIEKEEPERRMKKMQEAMGGNTKTKPTFGKNVKKYEKMNQDHFQRMNAHIKK